MPGAGDPLRALTAAQPQRPHRTATGGTGRATVAAAAATARRCPARRVLRDEREGLLSGKGLNYAVRGAA
ncbi:hypothetical protein ACFC5X_15290 [Streptomyces sp. NPDC055952]|uniref:hypothetical protein n=1 Tax=Streptomyces sp. NPDC055952 TaxID=3345663 RepID=UPI0035DCF335